MWGIENASRSVFDQPLAGNLPHIDYNEGTQTRHSVVVWPSFIRYTHTITFGIGAFAYSKALPAYTHTGIMGVKVQHYNGGFCP